MEDGYCQARSASWSAFCRTMESLWPRTNGELLSGGKRLLDSSEVKVPGELSDIYFNLDFSYLFNHPGGSLLLSFGYNSL